MLDQVNLKELTIRIHKKQSYLATRRLTESWLKFWTLQKFVPQKINIITSTLYYSTHMSSIWNYWISSNSESPPGYTGHDEIYVYVKLPLNLYPALPEIDFGQSASSPYIKASSVGLDQTIDRWRIYDQTRSLLLTDCTDHGDVMCRAIMRQTVSRKVYEYYMEDRFTDQFKFVTEFVITFDGLCSKDLEQLSVTWPNLQQLNIHNNKSCLNNLQGLRAIVNSCHNLQGLNLLGIPVRKVEDQMQLWKY